MSEQVADRHEIHNDCGESCLPAFFGSLERKLDSPLLQRAFDELKANPSAFVSVGEWANEVGVSREHLTRSISPIINPHALLQASRVAIALSRLAGQDRLRAGEALDAMGYSSRAHAFAVFKKTTGLTPTQYWGRVQAQRASGGQECISTFCPLVGAVVDRYWRQHPEDNPMLGQAKTTGNDFADDDADGGSDTATGTS
jgi:AraC-like DNA-binding protein